MSDDRFEEILEEVEAKTRYDSVPEEVAHFLQMHHGIKVIKVKTDFPGSPFQSALEIAEYEEVEE